MSIISIEDVSFRYPGQESFALKGLSVQIEKGELLGVLGGDNSGKTTFCRLLNGLIPHHIRGELSGDILVKGRSTRELEPADIPQIVGLAQQDPESQLFSISVEEEVAFGPENLRLPVDEIESRISWALEAMGLSDLRTKSPSAISGGEKQRLAIASVISMLPEVLVLDEPIGMLDPKGRRELLSVLSELRKKHDMTVILTEQSMEEIASYCDRIAIFAEGKVIAIDTPEKLLRNSERLISAGIEPSQLLNLSERLIAEGLLPKDAIFFEEEAGEKILRGLLDPHNGGDSG